LPVGLQGHRAAGVLDGDGATDGQALCVEAGEPLVDAGMAVGAPDRLG
jgi:hypothetical protein